MKKKSKLLTNEHLLTKTDDNFFLALEAIKIARKDIVDGKPFLLDEVLKSVKRLKEESSSEE